MEGRKMTFLSWMCKNMSVTKLYITGGFRVWGHKCFILVLEYTYKEGKECSNTHLTFKEKRMPIPPFFSLISRSHIMSWNSKTEAT